MLCAARCQHQDPHQQLPVAPHGPCLQAGWPSPRGGLEDRGGPCSSRCKCPSSPRSGWRLSPHQPHTAHPDTTEGRRLGLEQKPAPWLGARKRQPGPAGPAPGGREVREAPGQVAAAAGPRAHVGTSSPSRQGFSASLAWQGKGMLAPRPQSANTLVGRAASQLARPSWPPASANGSATGSTGVHQGRGRSTRWSPSGPRTGGDLHLRGRTPTLGTEPVWSSVPTASRAPRQRPTGHPPAGG